MKAIIDPYMYVRCWVPRPSLSTILSELKFSEFKRRGYRDGLIGEEIR